MSSIDIRNEDCEEVTEIVFAEKYSEDGLTQGHFITKYDDCSSSYLCIDDYGGNQIVINTVNHAQNLIKALNKAIELGWVK